MLLSDSGKLPPISRCKLEEFFVAPGCVNLVRRAIAMELGRNFLTELQQIFVSKINRYNMINTLHFLSLFECVLETSCLT